jgi:MoaA/NifB/PqqE/SkfB family radical SAM enzyme
MGGILETLRLKWFLATRSLRYAEDFNEILYRIYLNHSKVIHYREGRPVYSLSTPALYSKPAANFVSRTLYRSIQNRNIPNMMSFAVNDVCDAACEHCSFFAAVEEPGRATLKLEEARGIIREAQELGVSVVSFVGGEPLLREDLPEIIEAVDKDFSTTVLFTNGSRLEERARDLKRSGLDSVYVSIDAANAEKHDAFRRSPGLFEKALRGIEACRRLGFSTGFSVTMTPEAWQEGELEKIIERARDCGVHEVFVFDALPTGRYAERDELIDNEGWVEAMMRSVTRFNRDRKYPGVVFFSHVTSHRSVGCSCGTNFFYVSPYGDMMSCDFNHAKFGNVLEEPLWKVWERLSTNPAFCQSKWGGCKIKDSEFRALDEVEAGPVEGRCSAAGTGGRKE